MTKTAAPKTKTSNTKSNSTTGGKNMKLSNVKSVKLTQEEFNAKTPKELKELLTSPQNILSQERAKEILVDRIKGERLNSITPAILMDWTYKAVQVEGVEVKSAGKKAENASVKLTQKEFDALDATGKADLIEAHSHKRRVADKILPALVEKGMPLTAQDVVYVTNGRVEVEGVAIVTATRSSRPAIVDGITFA